RKILRRLVAPDLDLHPSAGLGVADHAHEIVGRADRLAVELHDHVAHLEAAFFGRAAGLYRVDERTRGFRQPERFGHFLGDGLNAHADAAAGHLARGAQLVLNVHGHVDRYGERQAHEAAGAAVDLGVDPDHFAAQVEQRAARVARVHGDVGLDERDEVFLRQRAAFRAHDAGRHGALETERRPDRDHPFADLQAVRIADAHRRQPGRVDLQQRDVGLAVGAYHLRLELALVVQLDRDLFGRLDDVRIGEHVAVGADDEARAEGLRFELARPRYLRHEAAEELVERIVFR